VHRAKLALRGDSGAEMSIFLGKQGSHKEKHAEGQGPAPTRSARMGSQQGKGGKRCGRGADAGARALTAPPAPPPADGCGAASQPMVALM
jgi:hypothetical protein